MSADFKADENDESSDSSDSDYMPSISDQLCIGYGTMDRTSQTKISEIIDIKQVSNILLGLLKDVALLEKNIYFAKTSLKAEYEIKLEEAVLTLHDGINQQMAKIESKHEEQIDVVRRCYRTQLSNAICKLSRDYHYFYGNKDAAVEVSHKQKLKEMQKQQEVARRNEIAQREMYEMMKLQMEDAATKVEELPSRKSSVLSLTVFTEEIEELKGNIKEFEARVDYLEDMLEETNKDNTKLNLEINDLNVKCQHEHAKVLGFAKEVKSLKEEMEQERIKSDEKVKAQEIKYKNEMKNQIEKTQSSMKEEAQKKMDELRKNETDKLNKQKFLEQQRLKLLEEEHQKANVVVEAPVDTDITRLQNIERKQRVEIARLQKDIEQTTKMFEIKVRLLTEHIHTLKDEMFLRTTLQRQTVKVKHATLTYVKKGSNLAPLGILPANESKNLQHSQNVDQVLRKHQLPNIIQPPKYPLNEQSTESNNIAAQ